MSTSRGRLRLLFCLDSDRDLLELTSRIFSGEKRCKASQSDVLIGICRNLTRQVVGSTRRVAVELCSEKNRQSIFNRSVP